MNENETRQLLMALRELADSFPRMTITQGTIKAYVKQLSDLPLPAVLAAIDRAPKTYTFFPSVAEIREIIGGVVAGEDMIAESAWTEVLQQVRRCGFNHPPIFQNGEFLERPQPEYTSPLIREAVESIGYGLICRSEKQDDIRKQFIFTFNALRKRTVAQVKRGDIDKAIAGIEANAKPQPTPISRKASA